MNGGVANSDNHYHMNLNCNCLAAKETKHRAERE